LKVKGSYGTEKVGHSLFNGNPDKFFS